MTNAQKMMSYHSKARDALNEMCQLLNNPDLSGKLLLTIHTADNDKSASYDINYVDCLEQLSCCLENMISTHTDEYCEWQNTTE